MASGLQPAADRRSMAAAGVRQMEITRRALLAGVAAVAAAVPAVAQRAARGASGGWYSRAIVIDALGGLPLH